MWFSDVFRVYRNKERTVTLKALMLLNIILNIFRVNSKDTRTRLHDVIVLSLLLTLNTQGKYSTGNKHKCIHL